MNSAHRFFLPYKPPYNWDRMLSFLAMRAIPGVETVQQGAYWRTVRAYSNAKGNTGEGTGVFADEGAGGGTRRNAGESNSGNIDDGVYGSTHGSACERTGETYTGWIKVANNKQENQLEIDYAPGLNAARLYLIERCRHLFDTECDPAALGGKLESMNKYYAGSFVAGTRIPGCYDGFEMACRAVLGQQISVKSASTLAGRMALHLGMPLDAKTAAELEDLQVQKLNRLFLTPEDIRRLARESAGGIEAVLGPLGIIGTRARTILALAELLERNPQALDPCTAETAAPEEKIAELVKLPGIGEWTAHYLAMRAMHYADAFPATDLGIIRFLGAKKRKELIAAAQQWRPWRAYAVLNMWSTEQAASSKPKNTAGKGQHAAGKNALGYEANAVREAAKNHTMQTEKRATKSQPGQGLASESNGDASTPIIATAWYETPLIGRVLVAATDEAIVGLWMEGQKYFGASMPAGDVQENPGHPLISKAFQWLDRYFAGEKPAISDLPLAPQGSAFRQTIWKLLCEIPYGQTTTYGELAAKAAERLGKEHMASLAVGGAVGHNPISLIIPCHRVVGANGSLTGYAGGLSKKVALLEHEGADTSLFFVPTKGTAL